MKRWFGWSASEHLWGTFISHLWRQFCFSIDDVCSAICLHSRWYQQVLERVKSSWHSKMQKFLVYCSGLVERLRVCENLLFSSIEWSALRLPMPFDRSTFFICALKTRCLLLIFCPFVSSCERFTRIPSVLVEFDSLGTVRQTFENVHDNYTTDKPTILLYCLCFTESRRYPNIYRGKLLWIYCVCYAKFFEMLSL